MKSYPVLTLLFVLCFSGDLFSRAIIVKGDSKITAVSVFKDRAFVKRVRQVNLKPGSFSVVFYGVTPVMDKDSLKVLISNKKDVQILGIRNRENFKLKSENKKLEKLYQRKDKLESTRRKIINQIQGVLKDHNDLGELRRHYNESFSLNMHKKKWTLDGFREFLRFLEKRADEMHGFWKKSYDKMIKNYKNLEFVQAQIQKLNSISDKKDYIVYVDLIVKRKARFNVEIQYLVGNVGWEPTYDIRVDSRNGKAIVEQYAFVWQKTGEDWSKVNLVLDNNATELKPKVPSISSYMLSYKEVKKVKTTVAGTMDSAQSLGAPLSASKKSSQDGFKLSKSFKIKGKQTVLDGMPKTRLFIQRVKLPYQEFLEVVPKQYSHVYKKGTLKNMFGSAILPGTAFVYYDGEFIQNFRLGFVPINGKFFINAGVDHSVVSRRHHHDKTKEEGLIGQARVYSRIYYITLKNYFSKRKKIKVLEQVPKSETKEIEITVDDGGTAGFKELDGFPSWIYWNVDLPKGESKTITLKLSVKTPKDYNFRW